MDAVEKMEQNLHDLIDGNLKLKTKFWPDLEHNPCVLCGYSGKVSA